MLRTLYNAIKKSETENIKQTQKLQPKNRKFSLFSCLTDCGSLQDGKEDAMDHMHETERLSDSMPLTQTTNSSTYFSSVSKENQYYDNQRKKNEVHLNKGFLKSNKYETLGRSLPDSF